MPHSDSSGQLANGIKTSPTIGDNDHGNARSAAHEQPEPIAIIGMACRLPGGIASDEDLWNFLVHERSGQCDVPESRFNIDAFYSTHGDLPDTIAMRGGYFIQEDVRKFENSFFGINNLEATTMDPQQRKLLEVCFESLENAGVSLEDVDGSDVGCYVANFTTDYQNFMNKDAGYMPRLAATGAGTTILSNRISYALNLKGPSLTLDTACSSSLYCLHLAVQGLRQHECSSALVAGSNLILSPEQHMSTARLGVLSPTSTCHSFAASADGYGRADGVGALYLKRLSDALRDGDPIRSVIRGTAINSNGKTAGITMPSSAGQEDVMIRAYSNAGLNPMATTYVECHGTGTQVGDPIEVAAVAKFFRGSDNHSSVPVFIGSVKSNLGHSEAASGITSVIKATLALERGWIPATIGAEDLNPKIDWNCNRVEVVRKGMAWPENQGSSNERRISVNSFGYGGSNGHCILERFVRPVRHSSELAYDRETLILLPFSAATEYSLHERLASVKSAGKQSINLADLAYTLIQRRSQLRYRGYVLVSEAAWPYLEPIDSFTSTMTKSTFVDGGSMVFVFTGQGAQWTAMGARLFQISKTFRQRVEYLDRILAGAPSPPEISLETLLTDPKMAESIHLPQYSQPACTAMQIALVDLLAEWQIQPAYVVGHSSGEIAAAYAAGFLEADVAILTAHGRGVVCSSLRMPGAMIAAGISEYQASEIIEELGLGAQVRVACVNSPESVTVSGDKDAIDQIMSNLSTANKFVRTLNTGGKAYHSHHMEIVGPAYQQYLDPIYHRRRATSLKERRATMISSVHARAVDKAEIRTPDYWRQNLENSVRFKHAIEFLSKSSDCWFVEVGPHSALELPIKQTMTENGRNSSQPLYLSTITRHKDGHECLLKLAGQLWCKGYPINLARVNDAGTSTKSDEHGHPQQSTVCRLARYPWCYDETRWYEPRISKEIRNRKFGHDELLGTLIPGLGGSKFTWRNRLMSNEVKWLEGHKLGEQIVLPGAAYIDMAVKAVQQITDVDAQNVILEIRDLRISRAMEIRSSEAIEVFTELEALPLSSLLVFTSKWTFSVCTFIDGRSTKHASGTVMLTAVETLSALSKADTPISKPEEQGVRNWYQRFSDVGLNFGSDFQTLRQIRNPRMRDIRATNVRLTNHSSLSDQDRGRYAFGVHPTIIDSQFQACLIATTKGNTEDLQPQVPTSIGHIRLFPGFNHDQVESYHCHASAQPVAAGIMVCGSQMYDQQGNLLLEIGDLETTFLPIAKASTELRYPMSSVQWVPDLSHVTALQGPQLSLAIEDRYASSANELEVPDATTLVRLVHTACLLRCDMAILEISSVDSVRSLCALLGAGSKHALYTSVTCAQWTRDGQLEECEPNDPPGDGTLTREDPVLLKNNTFDLILVNEIDGHRLPQIIQHHLRPDGMIFYTGQPPNDLVGDFEFVIVNTRTYRPVSVLRRPYRPDSLFGNSQQGDDRKIHPVLITSDKGHMLDRKLVGTITKMTGVQPTMLTLTEVTRNGLPDKCFALVTVELEDPVLARATQAELRAVQTIAKQANHFLWMVGGNLEQTGNPDMAAALGLVRAIALEYPTSKAQILALDDPDHGLEDCIRCVERVLMSPVGFGEDCEFIYRNKLLYVSRFVPDNALNDQFNQRKAKETIGRMLGEAGLVELDIGSPGQFDTLHFLERTVSNAVASDHVEIAVKTIGINAKDIYALSGNVRTQRRTFCLEFAGIVSRVGKDIAHLAVGDRVVSAAPRSFATSVVVPEWACVRMRNDEMFRQMAPVPIAYMTAIHALIDHGRLQPHESVLIHSAAGGVGMAAIRVAQAIGATVYATVGTREKRERLTQDFGIPPCHIFSSRDTSFLQDIQRVTKSRGVDVVLNSLTGERLHAGIETCASFGRFIEIGKRDMTELGKLNLSSFQRGLTVSAFDLSDYFYSQHPADTATWSRLLKQGIETYRKLPVADAQIFDVSQVQDAVRMMGNAKRMGKICVSMERPDAIIPVMPRRHRYQFSPTKCYILVGCLGGLGRRLARYMLENGARYFAFIGRTGVDKPAAKELVDDLRSAGASVRVVRGDVQNYDTVCEAVQGTEMKIGGVVQAAMGLGEALFESMTHEKWHASIGPKVRGTWNLHRAIEGRDSELDFFLMTSSLAGSMGTATESNYCAANSCLDYFARYRRALGRPAISIGFGTISEIGYLHEHPEIEAMLERRGLTATTEADMLDITDIALCSTRSRPDLPFTAQGHAHILTGLELSRKRLAWNQGYQGAAQPELADPRVSILLHAEKDRVTNDEDASSAKDSLPSAVNSAVKVKDELGLSRAILQVMADKLSQLVLMPSEKITEDMTLASLGMDSMLAAEFRSFVFHALKTDIPFLVLVDPSSSLGDVIKLMVQNLLA